MPRRTIRPLYANCTDERRTEQRARSSVLHDRTDDRPPQHSESKLFGSRWTPQVIYQSDSESTTKAGRAAAAIKPAYTPLWGHLQLAPAALHIRRLGPLGRAQPDNPSSGLLSSSIAPRPIVTVIQTPSRCIAHRPFQASFRGLISGAVGLARQSPGRPAGKPRRSARART